MNSDITMHTRPQAYRNSLHHKCNCNWKEECHSMQKMKWNNNSVKDDDSRKGDSFKMNIIVANGSNKDALRDAKLGNLHTDVASMTNLKDFHEARHKQLKFFTKFPKRKNPSTLLSCEIIKDINYAIDKHYSIMRYRRKFYFNIPNNPMHLIRNEVKSLSIEEVSRKR